MPLFALVRLVFCACRPKDRLPGGAGRPPRLSKNTGMNDEKDEFEPLEVISLPVEIEGAAADAGEPLLRLFFRSKAGQPGGNVAQVVVIEQWDRVAVALLKRVLTGDAPDGLCYGGETLLRGELTTIEIRLREPLGDRPVLDSSNGRLVPSVDLDEPAARAALAHGTPHWAP